MFMTSSPIRREREAAELRRSPVGKTTTHRSPLALRMTRSAVALTTASSALLLSGCSIDQMTEKTPSPDPTTTKTVPDPVVAAGSKEKLAFKFTNWSPDGDNLSIFGVSDSKVVNEQLNSPIYAVAGVAFDQVNHSKDPSKNISTLLIQVGTHKSSGLSVETASVSIGGKEHQLSQVKAGLYELKVNCKEVPRSTVLPIDISVLTNDGSSFTASEKVNSIAMDSADRSCVPTRDL